VSVGPYLDGGIRLGYEFASQLKTRGGGPMANVNVTFSRDASGLLAEIARVQAAIESLHGKSVEVDFPRLPGESDADYLARFEEFKRKLRGSGEAT